MPTVAVVACLGCVYNYWVARRTPPWQAEPTFWAFVRVIFIGIVVLGYGMAFYHEIGELWVGHYIAVPVVIAVTLGLLSYRGVETWQLAARREDARAKLQPATFWASVAVLWFSLSFYVFFAAYEISRVGTK